MLFCQYAELYVDHRTALAVRYENRFDAANHLSKAA